MRAVSVALLLGLAAAARAQGAPADSLTVDQAVRLTLQNHPLVEEGIENVRASEAQVRLAGVPLRPKVFGAAGYTRLGPVVQFEQPGGPSIDLYPPNEYDVHVGLAQRLYDFGQTNAAVDYAWANTKTAEERVEETRWDLAYQTTGAFYRILILRENITLIDQQLVALNQHLEISQKKFDLGTATKLDVLTTQVRLAGAADSRIDAVNALETQEIAFRRLTGIPENAPVLVRGSFSRPPVALDADSLVAAALAARPEIIAARDAETSAALNVRAASLNRRPTLSLSVTSGFKNGYFPDLEKPQGNYAASLSMELPVFDGGRMRSMEDVAQASLQSARARTEDMKHHIIAEVDQALSGAERAQERINNAQVQIARAQEALSMAEVQYKAGVITILDLLDAQTSTLEARLVELRARYDLVTSLDALDRATGKKIW